MKKILVVVDMQNDFITGPLGTPEAVSIVDEVVEKIRGEEWDYIYTTQDTHDEDYLDTQEGKKLPVEHCIEGTDGWHLERRIYKQVVERREWRDLFKYTFGAFDLPEFIGYIYNGCSSGEFEVTFVGVCTDICVISNALLLKAHYPEMKIVVDASCCAGSTPEKHRMALEVMKSCQVDVVNDAGKDDWFIMTDVYHKWYGQRPYPMPDEDNRRGLRNVESEE